MSAYEKFVEQAAIAMWESFRPGVWPRDDGVLEPIPAWADCAEGERESCRNEVRAALDVVGPLIAEDARDRMVAAAAVAVEREGCDEQAKIEAACKATVEYIVSEIERCAGVLVAESDDKGSFLTAAVLEKAASIARVAGGLS